MRRGFMGRPVSARSSSQSDIEMRVGNPAKGNSIKVGRSAAESGSRYAKIFVETANRFLSNQGDCRIPVFPQSIAEFVVCTFVIGAVVSNRNDLENSFRCVRDFSETRQIAFRENIFGNELPLDSAIRRAQADRL